MIATPPSPIDSSRLLGEALLQPSSSHFSDDDNEETFPVGVIIRRQVVGCPFQDDVSRALEDMMESAVRIASATTMLQSGAGGGVRIIDTSNSPFPLLETGQGSAETAVIALDAMLNSLFDHAALAASADEAVEEKIEGIIGDDSPVEEVEAAKVEEEEVDEEDVSEEEEVDEEDVSEEEEVEEEDAFEYEEESSHDSYDGPIMMDPILLAKQIAQHGQDILNSEDDLEDIGGNGRRRLTEGMPDVRRQMARRLTELETPEINAATGQPHFLPLLGLGPSADRCLWRSYLVHESVSGPCGDALSGALHEMTEATEPTRTTSFYIMTRQSLSSTSWAIISITIILLAFILFICDDDEEEEGGKDHEESNAVSDEYYAMVENEKAEGDLSQAPQAKKDTAAFTGVPVSVV